MISIDSIMEMLDWNNPDDIQECGRNLAREVKSINAFLQPISEKCGKSVWDNCAIILAERDDDELATYLYELLNWIMDMNWPGAFMIYDRLKNFKERELLKFFINKCIIEATVLEDTIWLYSLKKLTNDIRYVE